MLVSEGRREHQTDDGGAATPSPSPSAPVTKSAPTAAAAKATAPAVGPIQRSGFRAQLNGASLWDLVQMECLARSRRVVQVTGERGVGYLYFDAGRVVHAVTARLSGEAAALEVLDWTHGAFQPCERGWPEAVTIHCSPEFLILQAAKRRDEMAASNLVAFPGGRGETAPSPGTSVQTEGVIGSEIEEVAMPEMRKPNNNHPSSPLPIKRDDPLPDFTVMIRVAPNGAIVKNKGGTEDFAAVVAYTQRLVELVGEVMGLDRFVAMECTFKPPSEGQPGEVASAPRCLMFTEANRDTVALRPRLDSNIQPLRESLGL